jgi:hypothetical protein
MVSKLDTSFWFWYGFVTGRPIRIKYAGVYHITSMSNERRNIFLDDGDRLKFLEKLRNHHNRRAIWSTLLYWSDRAIFELEGKDGL